MCDSTAASVAAAPEVPEVDRGRIEPAPCGAQRLLERLRSGDRMRDGAAASASGGGFREPAPPAASGERLDAVGAPGARWPLRAEPASITLGSWPGLRASSGHRARVERPPSARG